MKKYIVAFVVIFFVGLLSVLSQPKVRHVLISGVTHFPEFAIMQSMKGGIIIRDYNKVISWLRKHQGIVEWYGKENNRLVPGFVENIKFSFDHAVLRHEREMFIPVLKSALEMSPDNVDLLVMLATAYMDKDSGVSLKYLDKVKKILPSSQRIYHIANIVLRDVDNNGLKNKWCSDYTNSQFGDYEGHKSSTLLGGGYRRLALEYEINDERQIVLNEGLQIGSRVSYEFDFGEANIVENPSIRFSAGGGIKARIHNVLFYSKGMLVKKYDIGSMGLYPESGYLSDGAVLSMNRRGENVYITFDKAYAGKVDKLIMDATVTKLNIAPMGMCS